MPGLVVGIWRAAPFGNFKLVKLKRDPLPLDDDTVLVAGLEFKEPNKGFPPVWLVETGFGWVLGAAKPLVPRLNGFAFDRVLVVACEEIENKMIVARPIGSRLRAHLRD
jgi:hypothetical protein